MFTITLWKRFLLIYSIGALLLFSCTSTKQKPKNVDGLIIREEQKSSESENPVVGAWRAGPSQLSTGDKTWTLDYTTGGQVIVFSASGHQGGYYCKMGVKKDRKNPFDTPLMRDPTKRNEAKAYLFDTFYANCGTYTISGQVITRQREFAKNQGLVGLSIIEEFKIDGDMMTTISSEPWWEDPSKTLTTTIVWTRIK